MKLLSNIQTSRTENLPQINPSLLLDFANSQKVPNNITFTRSSIASYIDKNGYVNYADSNYPRIEYDPITRECKGLLLEDQSTNLCTSSNDFRVSGTWWTSLKVNLYPNSEISPDGTRNATLLTEDTSNGQHFIYNTRTGSNETLTFSVYAKASQRTKIGLQLSSFATHSANVSFNLSDGTIISVSTSNADYTEITGSIQVLSNGWYRCSLTATKGSVNTTNTPAISILDTSNNFIYTGDGTSGLYIFGAQLENLGFPSSYIPSSNIFTSRASIGTYIDSQGYIKTAAINIARYNNEYEKYRNSNLLIENSSTNLLLYSNQFDNTAAWVPTGTNIVSRFGLAPDNTYTAFNLIEDTSNDQHSVVTYYIFESNTVYTFSVFVKADTRKKFSLKSYNATDGNIFILQTNIQEDQSNPFISTNILDLQCIKFNNGWYRFSCSFKSISALSSQLVIEILDDSYNYSYTGDGTSGLYIWGAQLELGYYTSYIPSSITFTSRSSNGSVIGPNGKMYQTSSNVRRNQYSLTDLNLPSTLLLETNSSTNLLTFTEELNNSAWTKTASSISANQIVAPDGNLTADLFLDDTSASTYHTISYNLTKAASVLKYSFSFFVKQASTSTCNYIHYKTGNVSNTNQCGVFFDFTTNTFANPFSTGSFILVDYSYDDYGDGWYRLNMSLITSNETMIVSTIMPSQSSTDAAYTGTGVGQFYLWGMQLEQASYSSSYIPSAQTFTSRAASNGMVLSNTGYYSLSSNTVRNHYPLFNPGQNNRLFETKIPTLFINGNDFSTWTIQNLTSSIDYDIQGPDNLIGATKLVENSVNGTHDLKYSRTGVSNETVTFSVFAKAGAKSYIQLQLSNLVNSSYIAAFDLANGIVCYENKSYGADYSNHISQIFDYSNGWYKCIITATKAAVNTTNSAIINAYDPISQSGTFQGDGTSSFYICGAHITKGPITLLEPAATNLISGWRDFTSWNNLACNILPYTPETYDPIGRYNATKLIEDYTTSVHRITYSKTGSNETLSFSVFAKAAELSILKLQFSNYVNDSYLGFYDLSSGKVLLHGESDVSIGDYPNGSADIETIGNGWYRCILTTTKGTYNTTNNVLIHLINDSEFANIYTPTYTGDGRSGLYIYGAQLEVGNYTSPIYSSVTFTSRASTASYINSSGYITSAAIDTLRNDYNPNNLGVGSAILLENSSTNYCINSEDIISWANLVGASRTSNVATAPNNAVTADKLIEDNSLSAHYTSTGPIYVTQSSNAYTYSFFAKAAGRTQVAMNTGLTGFEQYSGARFDLTNGIAYQWLGSPIVSIRPYPNGWYRCIMTVIADRIGNEGIVIQLIDNITNHNIYTGDGSSGVYIWGVQIEDGYSATSYITTTTSQVTRAADVFTWDATNSRSADIYSSAQTTRSADVYTGAQSTRSADVISSSTVTRPVDKAYLEASNFRKIYNPNEGSVYLEADNFRLGNGGGTFFSIEDGVVSPDHNNNAMRFRNHYYATDGSELATFTLRTPNSLQNTYPNRVYSTVSKFAFSYSVNNLNSSLNGATVVSDTSAPIPNVTYLYLGHSGSVSGDHIFGHIRKLAYYPAQLSNNTIRLMTT
jgi:hypothetical protein